MSSKTVNETVNIGGESSRPAAVRPPLTPEVMRIPLCNRAGETIAHALVDTADYAELAKYRWHRDSRGYARRDVRRGGTHQVFMMHRELMGAVVGDGRVFDHVNGNALDNRRDNLREVPSNAHNGQNRTSNSTYKGRPTSSKYRGVSWHKASRKWRGAVVIGRKKHHLGVFDSEEEAARVAREARLKHFPYTNEARTA